jgi:ribosomal protein S2/predicted RNA-binding protein with TRAM domain
METLQKNFKKDKSLSTLSNTKRKKNFSAGQQQNRSSKENFQPGDVLNVKITALGSKNIGVAELKNGYTVLVPNTKCGEKVQVKVEKIFLRNRPNSSTNQKIKYVVARLDNAKESNFEKAGNVLDFDFRVGQKLKVTIAKKGPRNSGLVQISKNFLLIVPNAKVGEKVCVEILKIKQNYAFAKVIALQTFDFSEDKKGFKGSADVQNEMVGQQFHIVLPSSTKTFFNYFVVKLNGNLVFVKKGLGVQLEDTVKIQIQKATKTFALAKILQVAPISAEEKKLMVKQTLQKMIQSSMHFGEKAIRCNANMRKYIWYRKKNFGMYSKTTIQHSVFSQKESKRPMMKRGRHILNVFKTQRCLSQALKQLAKYAAKGKTFLFVGTKKPAASLIAKTALLSHTSFFVNTRWLGGMLTNWKTILKSISQIRPILKQKQKILQKILDKRQKIQRRLLNKVYLLRKKSQKFMMKGKYLIRQILGSKNFLIERSKKLIQRKNMILSSNRALLNACKNLKYKKIQTFKQIQRLELVATEILKQKQQLKALISENVQKFKELEQFFEIGQALLTTKNVFEKNGGHKFVALSYDKFLTLKDSPNTIQESWNIPNPSPEIFKKMIAILSNLRKEDSKQKVLFAKNQIQNLSNRSKSESNTGNKTLVLSKFLNKFVAFLPFLKNSMQTLSSSLFEQQQMLREFNSTLKKIHESQSLLKEIYKKTGNQLAKIFSKFIAQRTAFRKFQTNLKQLASEQRLLKFLPKLRYLPTSQTKMYEIVELFMKKFVDPKLSYPMEQIYDQKLKFTSKKIAATRKQKWQRLEKYFGGITKMAKMNTKQISKNVAVIVGQQEEMNAVHECRKLGMKIFAVVDTNCNPKCVDHIIPANDDSRNSIKYILGEMLTYIRLGQKLRKKVSFRSKMQQNRKKRF